MEEFAQNEVAAIRKIELQGRLTARNIADLFDSSRIKQRTKAVLIPSAQTVTVNESAKVQEAHVRMLESAREKLKLYDIKMYYLFSIQFAGALRVSEVINIAPMDIDTMGNVRINAGKGGQSRIVTCQEAAKFLLDCKKNSVFPFTEFSRHYVYRVYKKYNIEVQPSNSSKKAVTHAIRHIHATAARVENFDNSLITNKLGHKNPNTQKHYGTYKPEKKEPK